MEVRTHAFYVSSAWWWDHLCFIITLLCLSSFKKKYDLYTTAKHVLCTQSGAVRQWYHVRHPDINKRHVQLFFMIATSGSGNGDSSENADLYKAARNFFLQLYLCLMTLIAIWYTDIQLVLLLVQFKMIQIRLQISVLVPQTPINVASST
jgi:hypothetical protein